MSEAACHLRDAEFDVKLLLHSLLYLSLEEARITLNAISAHLCLMVNPLISESTTVKFEMSIGISWARELVQFKEVLLVSPGE